MALFSSSTGKDSTRIAVIDDFYPHPDYRNSSRCAELDAYLGHFPNLRIYTSVSTLGPTDKWNSKGIMEKFWIDSSTDWLSRVSAIKSFEKLKVKQPDFFYFATLDNAHRSLPLVEKNERPFSFTLYPGEGFEPGNTGSDKKLQDVFASPYFRGVLVMNVAAQNYLADKGFCAPEMVKLVEGGILSENDLPDEADEKLRFGPAKEHLDIAFVADLYRSPDDGFGYDIFVEVAKALAEQGVSACFHVLGNYDESTVELGALAESFAFYGWEDMRYLDDFYADKDLLLAPNKAFGRFPNEHAINALVRKTAVFCTDREGAEQNDGQYEVGAEIEVIPTDPAEIAACVVEYYQDPEKLRRLGEAGAQRALELYATERQIPPRIEWLQGIVEP